MNLPDSFALGWAGLIDFLPRALAFLLTILIGWYVAQLVANMIIRGLRRVGFERVVDRGGIREALSSSGWSAADVVGKLAFLTIYLFVLQLAFGFFGPNPISLLLTRTIAFLPNIFVAILIIGLAMYIGSIVKSIVFGAIGGLSYGRTMSIFAYSAIMVIAVFAALNQLNIAPEIVNGLFYAMLAIIVGSAIIAVGGGGIVPMRAVWERALSRIQEEAPIVREHLNVSSQKVEVDQRRPYML